MYKYMKDIHVSNIYTSSAMYERNCKQIGSQTDI